MGVRVRYAILALLGSVGGTRVVRAQAAADPLPVDVPTAAIAAGNQLFLGEGQIMPPRGGSGITDEPVRAVAAYVWSLSHPPTGK